MCIINSRCEIESHCVGAYPACAGYGEVPTPHSCYIVPPNHNFNFVYYIADFETYQVAKETLEVVA